MGKSQSQEQKMKLRSGQKRSQEQSTNEEEQETARTNEKPAEPTPKLYRGNDFPDLDLTAAEIAFLNSEVGEMEKIAQNLPGPSSSKSTSPISISDDSGKEGEPRPIPRAVHDVIDLTSPVQNPAPKRPSQNHADVSVICLSDDDEPVPIRPPGPPGPTITLTDDEDEVKRIPNSLNVVRIKKSRNTKTGSDKPTGGDDPDASVIFVKRKPVKIAPVRKEVPKKPEPPAEEGLKLACPVCLDDHKAILDSKRKMMTTPCGHVFCDNCLKQSLKQNGMCPKCRKKITLARCITVYLDS